MLFFAAKLAANIKIDLLWIIFAGARSGIGPPGSWQRPEDGYRGPRGYIDILGIQGEPKLCMQMFPTLELRLLTHFNHVHQNLQLDFPSRS